MLTSHSEAEILRNILENIHSPERLDCHPWVSRLFVKDAVERNPHLRQQSPGRQLVASLSELFSGIMPSTPPRRGKRLDTHWGEFGILAALYFAPLQFGTQIPNTLRDAWGRIDPTILLYVFGCNKNALPEPKAAAYRLVGDEPEIAPTSTLSDWHRKGIQQLADAVAAREEYLDSSGGVVHEDPSKASTGNQFVIYKKLFVATMILMLLVLLVLGSQKASRIYRAAVVFRGDVSQLQDLMRSPPDLQVVMDAGPLLSKSKQDFKVVFQEVAPLLWLGPRLGWVPIYGGDLASSSEILQMANYLFESTETAYDGFHPLLVALNNDAAPDPSQLVVLLNKAQPELIKARHTFDQAMQLRTGLDLDRLSPLTQSIIKERLDPLMTLMDDGLGVATSLPRLLGAASDGPKTYLLLAQNEDELRPTGGFITAVGTLVVQNGKVVRVEFVDSGEVDNWDFPYPLAPWQLQQYMNSSVLILRDANWFPDFPTTTLYAESLYAYSFSNSVDGVIAFDQHMLVMLLQALGPIQVEGESSPIDAENVIAFMRSSKSLPVDQPVPSDWSRKGFMDRIAKALLAKIFEGQNIAWEKIGQVLFQGLNEDHLLLQLDDPTLTTVIAHHGWDGALRYQGGDFLMVVDANIGFNKTNAVVDTALSYDVDLSDATHPASTLTVTHYNGASADVACIHWGAQRPAGEEYYPIDACYWNYMRVYVPSGTELSAATPQIVPGEWMILNKGVNAAVDKLDEEVDGLQAFGMLMVVPGDHSQLNSLHFQLPDHVLMTEGDQRIYRLDVEKQPGTLATPITIRIHLPHRAVLKSTSMKAIMENHDLLIQTALQTDVNLEVVFTTP
jgi:Protein of unknown function (DUF4012)